MVWRHRPDLRSQAIKLRQTERLTNREIHAALGREVNLSSVTRWLKDYPLSVSEREAKRRANFERSRPYTPPLGPSALWTLAQASRITTSHKGGAAEAAVAMRCLLNGISVFAAETDCDVVDRIARLPCGKLVALQIRNCRRSGYGAPLIKLTRNPGRSSTKLSRFAEGDFDFLMGYDLYEDAAFIYSWNEVKDLSTSISVSDDAREAWHKLMTL